MSDYWSGPESRARKVRLVAHVHVTDQDGRHRVFGPSDEVPDWAKDQIGGHAWEGYRPPVVTGPKLEVVQGRTGSDGRPDFIDIECQGPKHQIHKRRLVARFEATILNSVDREVWEWEWQWTAKLNGPAGAFAAKSAVAWFSDSARGWGGTGVNEFSIGALFPADEQPMWIRCKLCPVRLDTHGRTMRRALDWLRHAKQPVTSLRELRGTIAGK